MERLHHLLLLLQYLCFDMWIHQECFLKLYVSQSNQYSAKACVCIKVSRKGESNATKVLRRMLTPRADGSLLIPVEILNEWKDVHGGGRDRVMQMWNATSHNKVGLVVDFVQTMLHGIYCQ